MNFIPLIILVLVVFYLGQQSVYSNQYTSRSGNPVEYGTVQEKPWLMSPFNQPTEVPQRNAGRRIFDVDPQPWDVKQDPEYYLADLQQRYPSLQLSSNLV